MTDYLYSTNIPIVQMYVGGLYFTGDSSEDEDSIINSNEEIEATVPDGWEDVFSQSNIETTTPYFGQYNFNNALTYDTRTGRCALYNTLYQTSFEVISGMKPREVYATNNASSVVIPSGAADVPIVEIGSSIKTRNNIPTLVFSYLRGYSYIYLSGTPFYWPTVYGQSYYVGM